jgi:hypothetical protein
MPDGSLFEDVSDPLRGLSPADLGELHCTRHRCSRKVWLGPATKAPTEHYEVQVGGPQYVPEAATLAIKVGLWGRWSLDSAFTLWDTPDGRSDVWATQVRRSGPLVRSFVVMFGAGVLLG